MPTGFKLLLQFLRVSICCLCGFSSVCFMMRMVEYFLQIAGTQILRGRSCCVKKGVLKISQILQESTTVEVSFLTKLQVRGLQLY